MGRVYDRIRRQRLSRRRLLGGAAALGAAGATLAACGGGTTTTTGSTPGAESGPTATVDESQVTKDGIRHLSFSDVLPTLNLHGAAALAPNLVFGLEVFDHMFYVPLDTQVVEPMLATKWENPDGEGAETIFTIQEAFFHDKPPVNGRQVLAIDIKASYESYAADNLAPGLGWHHDIMESVEAPDDLTVVIKQNQPWAWLFHPGGAGSLASSLVIPAETLDPEQFNMDTDLIGSGRMMLMEANLDSFFRTERHPNWRVEGEPWLAGSESRFISETAASQATFKAGNLDSIGLNNKLEADQMKADLGDEVVISSSINRSYHALMLNLDRVPAFQNPKVREAINLAINRQELIQGVELDAEGGVPAGPIPPALAAYELPQAEMDAYFHHDPEAAKTLLEEADFPFEKELTLVFPGGASGEQQQRAELLKQQFGAAGLNVRIVDQDLLAVWLPQTLPNGDFDMTSYTQLSYDDPHFPMSFYTTHSPLGDAEDPRGKNNMAYFDEELTVAIDDAESTLDNELLVEKVRDVVRMIMQKQAPMINLYASRGFTARRSWYKGHLPATRGTWAGFNGRLWIDTNLRGS